MRRRSRTSERRCPRSRPTARTTGRTPGMTEAGLKSHYSPGVQGLAVVSTGGNAYCVRASEGGRAWLSSGPTGRSRRRSARSRFPQHPPVALPARQPIRIEPLEQKLRVAASRSHEIAEARQARSRPRPDILRARRPSRPRTLRLRSRNRHRAVRAARPPRGSARARRRRPSSRGHPRTRARARAPVASASRPSSLGSAPRR